MLISYANLLLGLILSASMAPGSLISGAPETVSGALANISSVVINSPVPEVPFYSQFEDISDPEWQKLGCGIADLAMLIEFYKPGTVSVDTLLQEGINSGAFINSAGWSHAGLVALAGKYGLTGQSYGNATLDQLEKLLLEGPVIASIYYKFEFGNPIPHLVVINGISDGLVYYNDPAAKSGGKTISVQDFLKAWKKRIIAIRP